VGERFLRKVLSFYKDMKTSLGIFLSGKGKIKDTTMEKGSIL
jgi:hypothetical protein